jgi:hypothetical protein
VGERGSGYSGIKRWQKDTQTDIPQAVHTLHSPRPNAGSTANPPDRAIEKNEFAYQAIKSSGFDFICMA